MENSRILIIDDDRELCILIKKSVENEGIEADFCGTGREGMEMLECREYHLIILDVMMPGMDGFETLKKIRQKSKVPVLMFTSKNDNYSKVRGLRETTFEKLQATKPEEIIKHAVKGMLPDGKLGRQMLKKLKVYAGPEHAHAAQKPETWNF